MLRKAAAALMHPLNHGPVFLFENLTQHPMEMMHTLLFGR